MMMLMMMIQSRLCRLEKSDPSSTCHPSTTPAIFKRARVQPPEPESDEESESEDINHGQLGSQPPFSGNVPLPHDVPNSPSSPRSDITELWPPEGASLRNGTDDEDGEPGEQTDTPLDGLSTPACSHFCNADHTSFAPLPPAVDYDDWLRRDVGINYGHCIKSAELRLKQAQLDFAAASVMADMMNPGHVRFWHDVTSARKDAAVADWLVWLERCRCHEH